MKIENNKITEATRLELFSYWLKRGLDDFIEFHVFLENCVKNGTKVIEEDNDD